jgi:hypothetical protein
MKHGDAVAEACAESSERLRRQRDLRDQDECASFPVERSGAGLEVDLCLPAPRGAVEEQVRTLSGVERFDDSRERCLLRRAEFGRFRFSWQCVAFGRLRPLAARLSLDGCHERERSSGRRAVVLRDPEGELDQRSR